MSLELSALAGSDGFAILGEASGADAGFTVASAGDFNGDGIDDLLVTAPFANPHGAESGAVYVIFGSSGGFGAEISLSALSGADGFQISGAAAGDLTGYSASSAGDVNGDGVDDILIGAPGAAGDAGGAYVIFGKTAAFPAAFELSALNGSNGFSVNGQSAGDQFGSSVSAAGDLNGDGVDDIIIGASEADGAAGTDSGKAYVVFGSTSAFGPTLSATALDGSNGFVINGASADEFAGNAVSDAGDVNGDGVDDLVIGAIDGTGAGGAWVVYGSSAGFAASLDLSSLNGAAGFRINGVANGDAAGYSVSEAGDVNGDGIDDIIISALAADPAGSSSGASYVVFGSSSGFAAALELSSLDGTNGFVINGASAGDESGISVASAGDVNGDGVDDLLVGAFFANPGGRADAGSTYLIFGHTRAFNAAIDLSGLAPSTGLAINGVAAGEKSGASVAAGDVNDDGLDDIVIGAPGASPAAGADAGAVYVIFGNASFGGYGETDGADTIDGSAFDDFIKALGGGDSVHGLADDDTISGGFGDDTIDGGTGDDTIGGEAGRDFLIGGDGADTLHGFGSHDSLYGGDGDDDLRGGYGRDLLNGSGHNDVVRGFEGDDRLFGGGGVDTLLGGDDNDSLIGGGGGDRLKGDSGNDTLNGSFGADLLTGGLGDDLIEFRKTHGADIVTDFVAGAASEDVVRLIAFGAAFDSFAEVMAAATQVGADVVIDFGGGDSLTLQNVAIAALHADDFTFG